MDATAASKHASKHVQVTFFLAGVLGLFNFMHKPATRRYEKVWILTLFCWCMTWLFRCSLLVLLLIVEWQKASIKYAAHEDFKIYVQDYALGTLNTCHLWVGIVVTYTNHQAKGHLLRQMLNELLRCDAAVVRLIGATSVSVDGKLKLFFKVKVFAVILDILFVWHRPTIVRFFVLELEPLVIVNKIVLCAVFFEWILIQGHLTRTYELLNEFVVTSPGLSPKAFRTISRLSTPVFKLKRASNEYFKAFMFVSIVSLFRTIYLAYRFLLHVISMYSSPWRLFRCPYIKMFAWVCVAAIGNVVDVLMLSIMAEDLSRASKRLRWSVLTLNGRDGGAVQQMILMQAHFEDLRSGVSNAVFFDRASTFQMTIQVIYCVLVCLALAASPDINEFIVCS